MIEGIFDPNTSLCSTCGCSDMDACVDPDTGMRCNWVAPFLCSLCRDRVLELYRAATGRGTAGIVIPAFGPYRLLDAVPDQMERR